MMAKGTQLLLQVRQFLNARFHMGDVLVKNCVDGAAAVGGLVGQAEQGVNFFVAHVQRTAVADKAQTLQMLRAVHPEITRRAPRFGK